MSDRNNFSTYLYLQYAAVPTIEQATKDALNNNFNLKTNYLPSQQ